jgi:hypothetical protein
MPSLDPMQRAPAGHRGSRTSLGGDDLEDTGQLTLDDSIRHGRAARDHGVDLADHGAWTPWRDRADAWIAEMAATGVTFTADDMVACLGLPVASSPNAVGARFLKAARAGTIVKIGYRPSTRASRRASVVAVWQGIGQGGDA